MPAAATARSLLLLLLLEAQVSAGSANESALCKSLFCMAKNYGEACTTPCVASAKMPGACAPRTPDVSYAARRDAADHDRLTELEDKCIDDQATATTCAAADPACVWSTVGSGFCKLDAELLLVSLASLGGPTQWDAMNVSGVASRWKCTLAPKVKPAKPSGIATLLAAGFQVFAGYNGTLVAAGSITITSDEDARSGLAQQSMSFDMTGLDPLCNGIAPTAGAPKSCGVYIHSGTSCAAVGVPHYDHALLLTNPWLLVQYMGGRFPSDKFQLTRPAVTGYWPSALSGHALVLYDFAGAPIACALLDEASQHSGSAAIGLAAAVGLAGAAAMALALAA